MLVISNRPRASRSSDFEITRAITSWIVLHLVQLLLLIIIIIVFIIIITVIITIIIVIIVIIIIIIIINIIITSNSNSKRMRRSAYTRGGFWTLNTELSHPLFSRQQAAWERNACNTIFFNSYRNSRALIG